MAVVTGASRGAGRGIAVALGATGATVYVTGRTVDATESPLGGSVHETAAEIDRAGGNGIAVACDHADDAAVADAFARVAAEQGRIDILVNNAFTIPDGLTSKKPFWQKSLQLQAMLDVGLRSTYVSSYYAAPLLIARGGGLVVNTSSFGGGCYMHGPAYGAAKAGVDKMAHDMAEDFREFDVAAVSLWMGMLRTERTAPMLDAAADRYGPLAAVAESAQYPGRVIAALAASPRRMEYSGQVLIAAELGAELGVTDIDGSAPASPRQYLGAPTTFNSAVVR